MGKKTVEEMKTEKLQEKLGNKPERQDTGITKFIKETTTVKEGKKGPGRPKKEKRLQDGYKVSLSFPADWERRIKNEAEERGMAVTDFIRMSVAEYIK